MIRIQLPPTEAQRLDRLFRATADRKFRDRLQVVLMAHRGRARQDIAADPGVDRRTVTRWFNAYGDAGLQGLRPRKPPGKAPTIPDALDATARARKGPCQQHDALVGVARTARDSHETNPRPPGPRPRRICSRLSWAAPREGMCWEQSPRKERWQLPVAKRRQPRWSPTPRRRQERRNPRARRTPGERDVRPALPLRSHPEGSRFRLTSSSRNGHIDLSM